MKKLFSSMAFASQDFQDCTPRDHFKLKASSALQPSAEGIRYNIRNSGEYVLPFSTVDNKAFFSTSPDYRASYSVESGFLVDYVPAEDNTWFGTDLTLEFGVPLRIIGYGLGEESRGTDHLDGVVTYRNDDFELTNDNGSHYYYFYPHTNEWGKLGWMDGTVFGFDQQLTAKKG